MIVISKFFNPFPIKIAGGRRIMPGPGDRKKLSDFGFLSAGSETEFNEIASCAALISGCSQAAISFVSGSEIRTKAQPGTPIPATSIATVPLYSPGGATIGELAVKHSTQIILSTDQIRALNTLGKQVTNLLTLRQYREAPEPAAMTETLLENMNEGYVIQNEEGKISDFNQAALRILGLTANQLTGRDSMDPRWRSIKQDGTPFPGEEHPAMRVLQTGEKQKAVIMGITAPGRGLRWIEINSAPIAGLADKHALTTFNDVTDLMQQKALFESYKRGLDSYAIVAKTDRTGKIIYVNDRFCEISGYSPEELLGKDHRLVNSGHHSREFFRNMWQTISRGQVWSGEVLNRAKSGREYWVDTIISPIIDAAGSVQEYISVRYDITEKKVSELKLIHQENRLRQIFTQSTDPIMTLAPPSWRFTSCNPATLKMFQVASEQEFTACGPWDFSPERQPDDRLSSEKASQMIKEAMQHGSRFFEWDHTTSEGRTIPCTVLLSRIEEKNNVYLQAVVRDISAQKDLENRLIDSNQYLDLALEGAGLGIWDWDLTDNSVKFDRRWAAMLGLDVANIEMKPSTWESRVHPDDLAACYEDIKAYMEGKTNRYENTHRMRHADGSWIYILDRGRFSAWDDKGKPTRFTGTHLDITQAKRTEEHRLNELNDILSSAPSCLKIINSAGELLHMNSQGLALIEADDLTSVLKANVYDLVEPSHRQAFIELNNRVCQGSKESLRFEIIGLKGTRRWMETYAAPYRLPTGDMGHIAITNDITQRVIEEKQIAQQMAANQHQAKLASIGVLAAGVGHEINNPLAIVKGYLAVIRSKLGPTGSDPEEFTAIIGKIDTAVDRIAKIVQGLRTFSHTKQEDTQFAPTEALTETMNLISEIYRQEEIKLTFTADASCNNQLVFGNRGKFQQVIMNLLANAKDAVAANAKKTVNIEVAGSESNIVITISDNGCGISKDIADRIFEPFFTTKEVNKGTGLGLALSYQFIKEMNGLISSTSKIGHGSTFSISLPTESGMIPASLSPEAATEGFGGEILLVDDDEDIRDIMSEIFSNLGHRVTFATDGKSALELFKKEPKRFDLIISDLKMPIMGGKQLLEALNNLPDVKRPPFIVMTGGTTLEAELTSPGNSMADGILFKPFEISELKAIIARHLPDHAPGSTAA
jgi:PAS domain S-box-containing protein